MGGQGGLAGRLQRWLILPSLDRALALDERELEDFLTSVGWDDAPLQGDI
jgi:hypothetical protein